MKDSVTVLYIYTNIPNIPPILPTFFLFSRKLASLVPLCAYEAIKATAESLIVAPNDSFANRFESPFEARAGGKGRGGESGIFSIIDAIIFAAQIRAAVASLLPHFAATSNGANGTRLSGADAKGQRHGGGGNAMGHGVRGMQWNGMEDRHGMKRDRVMQICPSDNGAHRVQRVAQGRRAELESRPKARPRRMWHGRSTEGGTTRHSCCKCID